MKNLRASVFPLLLALVLSGTACTAPGGPSAKATFKMGDRVALGPLSYLVLDAEFKTELAGAKTPPKNRFLVIHLSATNGGPKEAYLPMTKLVAADGSEIAEYTDIENMTDFLGAIRQLAPSGTEQGYVVFDVPVGAYKLEVGSGGDPETEKMAFIEIPAQLAPATPAHVAGPDISQ